MTEVLKEVTEKKIKSFQARLKTSGEHLRVVLF